MRQFKFRVWNHKTNTWVESAARSNTPSLDGVNLIGETILLGAFMNEVSIEDLNDCTAVQSIGLLDDDKHDIFEGDILEVSGSAYPNKFQVVWADGTIKYDWHLGPVLVRIDNACQWSISAMFPVHKKVVGNIFENPEILTKAIEAHLPEQLLKRDHPSLTQCENCKKATWTGRKCLSCGMELL